MTAPLAGHPDPQRLRAFVQGRLAEIESTEIETHLSVCPVCAALLDRTVGLGDAFEACLRSASGPTFLLAPSPTSTAPSAEDAGTRIGLYRLLHKLGEGGMGTVWMAEQFAPVRRKVALKILRPGLDSEHVVTRFEAERQALALMDHPNIAKVLDAGTVEHVSNVPGGKGRAR